MITSGESRISQTGEGGGGQTRKGTPTYYLVKICQKLHEKNLTERGSAHPKFYYVDPRLMAGNKHEICAAIFSAVPKKMPPLHREGTSNDSDICDFSKVSDYNGGL